MSTISPMLLCLCTILPAQKTTDYFRINVIDEQTNRGVPLVELRTVNGIAHTTDSNGIVAFHEPGLMDKDVFFHVSSHGYEFAKDGFGYRGKALQVKAGGEATLKIRRVNIAERLYRVTGGGIYRDSVLIGVKPPIREPLLNGLVFGSDSVVNAVYNGKIHWFWGDTNKPSYPLGNFQVPGATSLLPSPPGGGAGGEGGLDPDKGVDFTYYVDGKGFAKETMRMPGTGPTWMTTLVTLPDENGKEKLYASYVKIKPPLTTYARGFAVFHDDEQQFKQLVDVDMKAPIFANGHAFKHEGHVYFAHPFPVTRVRASAKAFLNPEEYESYTCLKDGTRLEDAQFDRDEQGRLRYAWRKKTPAVGVKEESQWLKSGKIKAADVRWQLQERGTGKAVMPHAGSVYWNEYRKRWIMIVAEIGGTSLLGETWYAEADAPIGPWKQAVKIVTHERYSFYNPKQHPMFDKGRYIYFEGTYTHTFSGNKEMTPRYDYNQIMYKLDLDDARLKGK
jgi:hypothetical protein